MGDAPPAAHQKMRHRQRASLRICPAVRPPFGIAQTALFETTSGVASCCRISPAGVLQVAHAAPAFLRCAPAFLPLVVPQTGSLPEVITS